MENIILSEDQQEVFDFIIGKINSDKMLTSFGGYAGTGKTTLIPKIISHLRKNNKFSRYAFLSFTGKAASVLKQKLEYESKFDEYCYNEKQDFVGTIHSLIYRPKKEYSIEFKKYIITGWEKRTKSMIKIYNLLIIDEASMLPDYILEDLKSYNIPILVIGDHGQLPSVTKSKINVMENPDIKLTKIHRQCENSPIIKLSKFVRENGYIPNNTIYDKNVFKIDWNHIKCKKIWENIYFDESIVCLCGFNNTRVVINDMIRKRLGYDEEFPYPNERIICLKNDHNLGIMNGQLNSIIWCMAVDKSFMKMTLDVDGFGEYTECLADISTFNEAKYDIYDKKYNYKEKKIIKENGFESVNYFDFGYCTSVHKSQGSQYNRVVLFEQRTKYWDDKYYAKWLYTAITRAEEKLMVISNFK